MDHATAALVIGVGLATCIGLVRLLLPQLAGDGSRGWWRFSPDELGGSRNLNLLLASVGGLFLELLLIRWISSEIRIFAYFKNFVLISCFFGFGLGCHLCRRRPSLALVAVPLVLLTLLVSHPLPQLARLVGDLPSSLAALSGTQIWGVTLHDLTGDVALSFVEAIAVSVTLFALIALIFVPLGQLVGWYLESSPRGIWGYTVNVLGSLAGVLLFSLLAVLRQPPVVWLTVGGALLLALTFRQVRQAAWVVGSFSICCILPLLSADPSRAVYWSPYQKLSLGVARDSSGQVDSYELQTNNSWYQQVVNLSDEYLAHRRSDVRGGVGRFNGYDLPYRFYPRPARVLVLGSGMGNDVAAALRGGAERVVAVEIDPVILDLGRELHFEHPYQDRRVEVVVDDARCYLERSRERFDLVVYGLLDSHTTVSSYTNIRIDNFVYTEEAFRAARRLLDPDGLMVVKFEVHAPWIGGRLAGLLRATFGVEPVMTRSLTWYATGGSFYVIGSPARLARALSDQELLRYVQNNPPGPVEPAVLTTDDWPFFYQQKPGVPLSLAVISLVLVGCSFAALRTVGLGGRSLHWHFFWLGAGFLLLEVHIVSQMALLFGTTWTVNALVIGAVLVLIVGANFLAGRWDAFTVERGYLGLFVTLLVSATVSTRPLLAVPLALRVVGATVVLCAPVLFAGIVFVRSFQAAGFEGGALGSNLLGALVGGLLEGLAQWTGLRSMVALAALLYVLSWLTSSRWRGGSAQPAADVPEASGV